MRKDSGAVRRGGEGKDRGGEEEKGLVSNLIRYDYRWMAIMAWHGMALADSGLRTRDSGEGNER